MRVEVQGPVSWKRNVYVPFIHRVTQFEDLKSLCFGNVALFANMNVGLSFTNTHNNTAGITEILIILGWKIGAEYQTSVLWWYQSDTEY